jgi:hypothetical protein
VICVGLFGLLAFVYVPPSACAPLIILLTRDHSRYDWDSYECEFTIDQWMLPALVAAVYLTRLRPAFCSALCPAFTRALTRLATCGGVVWCGVVWRAVMGSFVAYRIWSRSIRDGFGIRSRLQWTIAYGNSVLVLWVVLNVCVPRINIEVVHSGYLMLCAGWMSVAHLCIHPALQTRTFQRVTPPSSPMPALARKVQPLSSAQRAAAAAHADATTAVALTSSTSAAAVPPAALALVGGAPSPSPANRSRSLRASVVAAQPLARLLSDAAGYDRFLEFARSEFNSENVLFWKAVEEYRAAAPPHTPAAAMRLYDTFVSASAELQVNLSHATVHHIQAVLGLSPTTHTALHMPSATPPTLCRRNTALALDASAPPQARELVTITVQALQPAAAAAAAAPAPAPTPAPAQPSARALKHSHSTSNAGDLLSPEAPPANPLATVFDVAQKQILLVRLPVLPPSIYLDGPRLFLPNFASAVCVGQMLQR